MAFSRWCEVHWSRALFLLCQYYLKTGTCKFGATCKYHHPREKAGSTGRVQLNVLALPMRPVCFYNYTTTLFGSLLMYCLCRMSVRSIGKIWICEFKAAHNICPSYNAGREGVCVLHAHGLLQVQCNLQVSSPSTNGSWGFGAHLLINLCNRRRGCFFVSTSTVCRRSSIMANCKSSIHVQPTLAGSVQLRTHVTSRPGYSFNARMEYISSENLSDFIESSVSVNGCGIS